MSSDNPPSSSPPPESPQTLSSGSGELDFLIQHLLIAVECELHRHPAGLSELQLIKILQRPPWELLGQVEFSAPEKLYPVHFLLFHVLYRLRDQVAEQDQTLSVSPLMVRLQTQEVVAGTGVPVQADPLRAFYLDLSHYELAEDDIHRMIDDFWSGFSRPRPPHREVEAAARQFGFEQLPLRFDEIKQQFRRAVMQAHPDRGGSTEQIQSLNHAFAVLKTHFQN